MCIIVDRKVKPVTEGYKVFDLIDGRLESTTMGNYAPLTVNKWLDEKGFRSSVAFSPEYGYGWHVFHYKKDARGCKRAAGDRVIKKVLVREPNASGYQNRWSNNRVTVCRYIKILPDEVK